MLSPVKSRLQSNNLISIHHPNVDRVKQALALAVDTQNWHLLREVLAEDMTAHVPGQGPSSGQWDRDEWLGCLSRLAAARGEQVTITPTYVAGNNDMVMLFNKVTAQRNGRQHVQIVAETWRFAGGRCVEVWDHFTDENAWNEFWA
jgi:ketosteroid isomerase-like protein